LENQSNYSSDPQLSRLIRWKVRRLCRNWNLPRTEADILEHDVGVHHELATEAYDQTQGARSTFDDRVIEHYLNSYLRHRFAAKRDPRREECSLNERARDASGRCVERHELIEEAAVDPQRIHDLCRDLEALRACLPSEHHRRFLDLKARGGTINSIAIELSLTRPRTVLIEIEVRDVAIEIGLDGYLGS